MIENYAVVLGVLFVILGLVFYTASHRLFQRFYAILPPLLFCYFVPGLLSTLGVFSGEVIGEKSQLYQVVSQYLLPATLVLFTLSMDLASIRRLGPRLILVFLAGTVGVMLGGPVALWVVSRFAPDLLAGGPDAPWRGLATLAGSWIGGGANQTALREVFHPSEKIFSQTIAVDVIVAELWLALLLYAAGMATRFDGWLRADATAVDEVRKHVDAELSARQRIPTLTDLMLIGAVGFGITGAAHALAGLIVPYLSQFPALEKFSLTSRMFWVISLATLGGIGLSLTPLRRLEYAGASRIGTVFLYLLVATIGLKMDLTAVLGNPALFAVGALWISIHGLVIFGVARLLRAPLFFVAVGSQANIGAAASAPVMAAAFHPALAPVGVLLAILGYAIGTYAGYLTGLMLQAVSNG